MNETPIIEGIRQFIKDCPYLPEFSSNLNIDRLDESISSYSVEAVPCKTVLKVYISGASVRQFEFHFSSTEAYTSDVLDAISNSGFYDSFASWLERCTSGGHLPLLGDSRKAMKVEALTTGYVASTDETTARYVIQCRLIYLQAAQI